jgi:tetratricopeptide (TPR) repeat protein
MEKIERLSKVLSAIAIPVIVAWFGWTIQESISDKNLSRDYVKIAIDILTSETDIDNSLRVWAVDLLNDNTTTKMDVEVIKKLKSGEIRLPSSEQAYSLIKENKLEESLTAWTTLIENQPIDFFNYFHRATVYRKMGKFDLAIKDLNTVISLSNTHSSAYNNRGSSRQGHFIPSLSQNRA